DAHGLAVGAGSVAENQVDVFDTSSELECKHRITESGWLRGVGERRPAEHKQRQCACSEKRQRKCQFSEQGHYPNSRAASRAKYVRMKSAPALRMQVSDSIMIRSYSSHPRSTAAMIMLNSPDT